MDEENNAITEIVTKIAAVKEKRAAIGAENKNDGEALDEKVEKVAVGNRKWAIYDCEKCDFMTTDENKARAHGLTNPLYNCVWCDEYEHKGIGEGPRSIEHLEREMMISSRYPTL